MAATRAPPPAVSRVVAWSALGFTALSVAAQVILKIALSGAPPQSLDAALYALVLAYAAVGAFVASHHPRNAVPWIFCGSAALAAAGGVFGVYADAYGEPAISGPDHVARVVSNVTFVLSFLPLLTFGLLLFPDGRLPSPRWRPFAVLAFVAVFGRVGANVSALDLGTEPWQVALENIVSAAALLAIIGSAASLGVRFRGAGAIERQQLKFAFVAAALVAVIVPAFVVLSFALGVPRTSQSGIPLAVVLLAFATLPLAMSVAILRYRLYDIDVLIRRTLVYAAVSTVLLAAYVGGVALFESLLGTFTAGNGPAVAISTLAVVALFQPVRRRIQSAVDRRFYRSRYNATRILDDFSVQLLDQVALDAVRADLLRAVRDTVQPAHASVWLRERRS